MAIDGLRRRSVSGAGLFVSESSPKGHEWNVGVYPFRDYASIEGSEGSRWFVR
jgi:hypothetical protein